MAHFGLLILYFQYFLDHTNQIIHFLQVRVENLKLRRFEKSVTKMLNPDQLQALSRRSTRGLAWSTPTIKKALRLRFSCGTSGYNDVREDGIPLPGVSTLTEKLKHINFSPGVLSSVFRYLEPKVILNIYHILWAYSAERTIALLLIERDGNSITLINEEVMQRNN